MLRKTRGIVALLLISAVFAASACDGSGKHPDISKVPFDPPNAQSEILKLAGLLPKDEAGKLAIAEIARKEAYIKSCMAAQKFIYFEKPAQSLVDFSSVVDQSSISDAQTHGFGVATIPHFAKSGPENGNYYRSLNVDEKSRYDKAISSCSDFATAKARVDFGIDVATRDYINIRKTVEGSSEYQAASSAWRKCATAAGYNFASRDDLVSYFIKRRQGIKDTEGQSSASVNAAPTGGLEGNPEFVQLHNDEIRGAVATFQCTQAFNDVRRRMIESILQAGSLSTQPAASQSR